MGSETSTPKGRAGVLKDGGGEGDGGPRETGVMMRRSGRALC